MKYNLNSHHRWYSSFPFGVEHFKKRFDGNFIPLDITGLLKEMKVFISHTELEATIYRSNHASNYLVLEGILPRNKQQFIDQINYAINNPDIANLREEWQRGYKKGCPILRQPFILRFP